MDLPHRDPVARLAERLPPGDDVQVIGVDQRPVDVEDRGAFRGHPGCPRPLTGHAGPAVLPLGPLHVRFLVVAADLDQGDLGEPRLDIGAYRLDDGVHVVPAGNGPGHVLGPYELGGTLERGRSGQFGVDRPAAAEPAELLMGAGDRRVTVGVVTDRQLADFGLSRAAVAVERGDQVRLGFGGDHQVGETARRVHTSGHPRRRHRSAGARRADPTKWRSRRRNGHHGG